MTDIEVLRRINWDFPDYYGTPTGGDLASIHWYPGTFIPQIPSVLIQTLCEPGAIVADPFLGSGTTAVEASREMRPFVGCDANPVAVDISKAKFDALQLVQTGWFSSEIAAVSRLGIMAAPDERVAQLGLDPEILSWYDMGTLAEILALHEIYLRSTNEAEQRLRRVILSAILNKCVADRPTYNHITDGCFPRTRRYIPALKKYLEQVKVVERAAELFLARFHRGHGYHWPGFRGEIREGDARSLTWIQDDSVDLVLTSPPYLGVTDYVRSMRLHWLFFPSSKVVKAFEMEIGARRKRTRKNAYGEFLRDLLNSADEMARIVKPGGYVCLVIGEGRGRVARGEVIKPLASQFLEQHGFSLAFDHERRLAFTRVRVATIQTERILVFRAPS